MSFENIYNCLKTPFYIIWKAYHDRNEAIYSIGAPRKSCSILNNYNTL